METSEQEHGSRKSESQARAVRLRGRRLVWTGRYFVCPPLLSVEGVRYVVQLALWGVGNQVEVTE